MRRSIYFIGCLLAFINVSPTAMAQLSQAHRFEQEIKSSEEGFTVISLKKEGLAMIRDINKYDQGKKKWQLEFVDTTLTKIWTSELELSSRLQLVGHEYNAQHLYLLFRENDKAYYKFHLLTIDFIKQTIEPEDIKFEVEFKLTHFTMSGTSAIFGGYLNNEPAVLLYNKSSSQPKILPGLFVSEMKLLDVRANQNESFNILLSERRGKDKTKLIVRTFDHNGNLLIDDIIEIDAKYSVLTGLTGTLEREELIVAGTYAEGSAREAIGFFSFVVDPFSEQPVFYNDFGTMDHFLDYLPTRRAEKIKVKTQKLKSIGQLPNYSSLVMPFRIEERPDGFYLLAEVYQSSSNSYNNAYGSSYYSPYMNGYSPYGISPYSNTNRYYSTPYLNNNPASYSDVKMMESVVVKIAMDGQAQKSASIKLDDVRQSDLEQVGDFVINNDSIFLLYKKDGEIFYQEEIGDEDEKVEISQSKIKLQGPKDELKDENSHEGTTRYWYGHHFYVWGYQTIKDSSREADKTRRVFYVNRISVN